MDKWGCGGELLGDGVVEKWEVRCCGGIWLEFGLG